MEHNEAKLYYRDGDYDIITYGAFVKCAVTGEEILLDDLKYWSVAKQEAYKNCEVSLLRQLDKL